MFALICAWINDWVNNGEAGDLRSHRAHCDVIVICLAWYQRNTVHPSQYRYCPVLCKIVFKPSLIPMSMARSKYKSDGWYKNYLLLWRSCLDTTGRVSLFPQEIDQETSWLRDIIYGLSFIFTHVSRVWTPGKTAQYYYESCQSRDKMCNFKMDTIISFPCNTIYKSAIFVNIITEYTLKSGIASLQQEAHRERKPQSMHSLRNVKD